MQDGYLSLRDGARLFLRQVGPGTATVLVPDAAFLFDHFSRLASERTVVFYDVRNRGRSDMVQDRSLLARGIHQDVDDLEEVRQQLGLHSVDLIGHSYWAVVAVLHALKYGRVNRIVQIGPAPPDGSKVYPPDLAWQDQVSMDFHAALANLQTQRHLRPLGELRAELISWLRRLLVLNSADVAKLQWNTELENEAAAFVHINQNILPTLQALRLQSADLSALTIPVLTLHGRKDRQAPYGSGRDWVTLLPNARLVTIEEAAHAPWIEAPELVFGVITTFLRGAWPQQALRAD